jgi:uncharacterized protein YjbJ (UPF0337 family)
MANNDPERQKAEGTADKIKGRAKEAWGAVTGDNKKKAEGQGDQLKGGAKETMGDVRGKIRDNI